MMTSCGTLIYMAPEIFRARWEPEGYGRQCDMWSVGVVTFVILSGQTPFPDEPPLLYDQIAAGKYNFDSDQWLGVSKEAQNIVTRLMDINVETRLTPDEVLRHPFVRPRLRQTQLKMLGSAVLLPQLKKQALLKRHRFKTRRDQ